MIDPEMAERIRLIIREKGGYDQFSELTQINRQTLLRIATAKTEPKIGQVMAIATESGVDIKDIVYGKETNDFLQSLHESEDRSDFYSAISSLRKKMSDKMAQIELEQVEIQRDYDKRLQHLEKEIQALRESK
ncbi:hypothetical protein VQ7734_00211 [Vibrio quintilis]|uniref:HTH cro/C1-type domain-containing protein n=4 Tax=Vibrio quintilis TaxID=1117707 RepID=A0A1M7YPF5_9VIBR|nr:hypothetical protein VQ7734_00211 [Vibrio quintilis]